MNQSWKNSNECHRFCRKMFLLILLLFEKVFDLNLSL